MWKRVLLVVAVLVLVAVVAYLAMTRRSPAPAVAEPTRQGSAAQAPILPAIQSSNEVVADAVVVPVRNADLSLPAGGIVAEILVEEGQPVAENQLLLRLDAARQQASVAQAEAGLNRAQAQLDELRAGPRPEEVEAAQAAVDTAQAQLDRLKEGARSEEIAAAEAALDGARAALQKVLEGADENQVIAAQANVNNAEAALRQAQAAYDQVSWREDIGRLPQALELEQATNAYNAAQARLEELQRGATAADIAAAQAQVRQAQAQLDGVKAPARASDIAAAQAELRRAQAQLDLTRAAARPEAVAVAEAEVASAKAALALALAALDETTLTAPFAGTVAEIIPTVGEQVGAGQAVLRLADLSAWRIETDDLTELQVVRVGEGDQATIGFDALPDLELSGTVLQIKPIGVNKQGDITYTVVIVPEGSDPRLRWNMTAVVTIRPQGP